MPLHASDNGREAPPKLPTIGPEDEFAKVVRSLSDYFVDEFYLPSTFDQLRTTAAGNNIHILVAHLVRNVTNPGLINALLTLKWHFSTLEVDDHRLNETRAYACEIVAWRFLAQISERDAVDFCLYELPESSPDTEQGNARSGEEPVNEHSSLLPQFRAHDNLISSNTRPESRRRELLRSVSHFGSVTAAGQSEDDDEDDPTSSFTGLNALEIAAVADCKRFLSQKIVQKIITGIWDGDITFFQNLSETSKKKPQFYNKRRSDPFIRLRVPKYIKAFEVVFFATFLTLYYAVLVERNAFKITPIEICLYIWFAAFTYDEVCEFFDAGSIFYAVDIWNGCDVIIILIGAAFFITRIVGLMKDDDDIIGSAFNILSLEALFMVPRICSILSLHPYFGTLIPCLKEMAKDFVKFMVIVAILYIGFLTTFCLLAREIFTIPQMSWILIKVFFGSSYLGFDIMDKINPILGPPLMLIFVTMTNILLVTSLISILSDSFSKVIAHAREEYLFVYSVYVLEASTSNRLTHFYPPLNVIPLILVRPLRLFLKSEQLRKARIVLLKVTHAPIVGAIWLYETAYDHIGTGAASFSSSGPGLAPLTTDDASPPKRHRPFLSDRAASKTISGHFVEFTNGDGTSNAIPKYSSDGNKETAENGKVVVHSPDLEAKVAELSTKIAELTALIMAQQGAPTTEL